MLKLGVGGSDFDKATAGLEDDVARFMTAAMRDTVVEVKEAFRDQVRSAGLGDRLANAVRGVAYPDRPGRFSLEPAGEILAKSSKEGTSAAAIIDSYAEGRMIVPRDGRHWLLVPTDDCPRKRRGEAFTLAEVEVKFGRLQWVPAGDRLSTPSARGRASFHLVTKSAVIRKSSQRWRKATPRELAGRTRNPRPVQTVIMFNAVRAVKKPKSIDLSVPAALAEARFPANLDKHWR